MNPQTYKYLFRKKNLNLLLLLMTQKLILKNLGMKLSIYLLLIKKNLLILQKSMDIKNHLLNFDSHIFGKFGERMGGGLRYFLYGFFTQNPGMGIQDSFGHRININLNELKKRNNDHFVIAVFGGSGAYGNNVSRMETFVSLLEKKLNNSRDIKKFKKFTILNFSQQASLVINQLISYQLFVLKLILTW